MKKRIICILIIFLCLLLATVYAMANSNEYIVEKLIRQRTDTLSLYYSGQADKNDTKRIIKNITTDFLRDEDLENIDRYFKSEIEQVRGYEIADIDIYYTEEDIICAYVTINWKAESLKGKDNFTYRYSTICKKEEKSYKLAQFF